MQKIIPGKVLAVLVLVLSINGCAKDGATGSQAGGSKAPAPGPKTQAQKEAFKGGPPPPEVQKQIDATMAGLKQNQRGGNQSNPAR